MRIDYITDDSGKSLSPFFSGEMISIYIISLIILSFTLILSMPWKSLSYYIRQDRPPLTFFAVFITALLVIPYLSLKTGRGEMAKDKSPASRFLEPVIPYEQERHFLGYGLPQSFLHTILFLFPMFPIAAIAAGMTGIGTGGFISAFSILFMTSIVCRLFGFMIFLSFGKNGIAGLLFTRIFYFLLIFATGLSGSEYNPVRLIYDIQEGVDDSFYRSNSYLLFMLYSSVLTVLLIIMNYLIISLKRRKGR